MQSDRELLELAAKAAGYITLPHPNRKILRNLHFIVGGKNWNPLEDDGDALRLAVDLRLNVKAEEYGVAARRSLDRGPWSGCEAHLHGGHRSAARRAIVLAAVEIGKEME